MELSLDTKTTKLGVLKSRRTFIIDDMAWDKLMTSYSTASPARAASIERQLASTYHRRFIKPGEIVVAREASAGAGAGCCAPASGSTAAPAGLSAKVAWYPEKDVLRLKIGIIDAHFASCSKEEINNGQAYVMIQASPPGSKGRADGLTLVPMGSDGKAMVYGRKDTTATWKQTKVGYDLEARVPWKGIVGFKQDMRLLPVQVQVESNISSGASKSARTGSQDEAGARAFVILKLKK